MCFFVCLGSIEENNTSTKEISSKPTEQEGEPPTKETPKPCAAEEHTETKDFLDKKLGDLLMDSSLKIESDESAGQAFVLYRIL